jgi:transcriptional regulator with XRE-family HTH domain
VNTSFRVVELVRQKIGSEYLTASDADVSRVLDVSRTTISNYRHGKIVMSLDTFAKAQELLGLPEQQAFELMLALSAEGSTSSQLQGLWQSMQKAVKKGSRAAVWALAVMLSAGTILAPTEKAEANEVSSHLTDIHYAKSRRRRGSRYRLLLSQRLRSFLMPFPSHRPLDALASTRHPGAAMRNGFSAALIAISLTGCAALSQPQEMAWQSLNAVDMAQTYSGAGDRCYGEGNPVTQALIGEHPTHTAVVLSSTGYALAHAAISEALLDHDHPTLEKIWQYATLIDKAYAVGHNYYIGIRIGGSNKPVDGCSR